MIDSNEKFRNRWLVLFDVASDYMLNKYTKCFHINLDF